MAVIATVFNEEANLEFLLEALVDQTYLPQEVIIVDGGSTDSTRQKLQEFSQRDLPFKFQFVKKSGNRSLGRNTAIGQAQSEWLAITDAGCVPNARWLEMLVVTQQLSGDDVVAGYYQALATTDFQEAVAPYFLTMPDQVNFERFLPAARSVLMSRQLWSRLGGFDQSLNINEDYALARRLASKRDSWPFAQEAVVGWFPPSSLREFWQKIFNYAQGDVVARLWRSKVALIFLRYLALVAVSIWLWERAGGLTVLLVWLGLFLVYSLLAIMKNKRYAPSGWRWLPILQVTADIAVMLGSFWGMVGVAKNLIKTRASSIV